MKMQCIKNLGIQTKAVPTGKSIVLNVHFREKQRFIINYLSSYLEMLGEKRAI